MPRITFRVGDRVECIDASDLPPPHSPLTLGSVYTVSVAHDTGAISLLEHADSSSFATTKWKSVRFRFIPPPPVTTGLPPLRPIGFPRKAHADKNKLGVRHRVGVPKGVLP